AGAGRAADARDRPGGLAAAEFLVIDVPVAADFDLAPLGEEVHRLDADAVQAAGRLVGLLVELAADVQHGHHGFERGDVAAFFLGDLLVPADGDAAAVVGHGDRAVAVDGDTDFVAEAGHGLVDRVGHQLVDQVVHA